MDLSYRAQLIGWRFLYLIWSCRARIRRKSRPQAAAGALERRSRNSASAADHSGLLERPPA